MVVIAVLLHRTMSVTEPILYSDKERYFIYLHCSGVNLSFKGNFEATSCREQFNFGKDHVDVRFVLDCFF